MFNVYCIDVTRTQRQLRWATVATIDMGRKEEGAAVLCPFRGELGPHLTQCGLGQDVLPYQVAFSSIQPFRHNRHEPKTGAVPLLGELRPI